MGDVKPLLGPRLRRVSKPFQHRSQLLLEFSSLVYQICALPDVDTLRAFLLGGVSMFSDLKLRKEE